MSAICGMADLNFNTFDFELLRAMAKAMTMQGWDTSLSYIKGGVGLQGDLKRNENGQKSLFVKSAPSGNLAIIFDGELSNKKELSVGLSLSDNSCSAELALSAYATLGVSALSYLDGEFAFAIYNEQQKELLLAKDKKGAKPLFYTLQPQALIFASEITPLLCALPTSDNPEKSISELPSGCFAVYSPFGLEICLIGEPYHP